MSSDSKDFAPKVDFEKDKLTAVQKEFMYRIQQQNNARIAKLTAKKRRGGLTGLILGISAASIYAYTIYAIKQERFLDDFNEPEKISEDV